MGFVIAVHTHAPSNVFFFQKGGTLKPSGVQNEDAQACGEAHLTEQSQPSWKAPNQIPSGDGHGNGGWKSVGAAQCLSLPASQRETSYANTHCTSHPQCMLKADRVFFSVHKLSQS